jgi:hypothetical protein
VFFGRKIHPAEKHEIDSKTKPRDDARVAACPPYSQ